MKEQIKDYILTNRIINEYFNKVDYDNRKDFKQYIWLTILEMINDDVKYIRIEKLYLDNQLGKFIVGIINNQLKSHLSPYTILYKNKKVVYGDLKDRIEDESEIYPDTKIIINKIINELNNIRPEEAILYKLYRGIDPLTNEIVKPLTYQQIQGLIGINYQAVRNAVMKVEKQIKSKIKLIK